MKIPQTISLITVLLMIAVSAFANGISEPPPQQTTDTSKTAPQVTTQPTKRTTTTKKQNNNKTNQKDTCPPLPPKKTNPCERRLWNLQNADILAVISAISQETGKNFVIDPRVQGKITFISSSPITPDQAYQAFLSALQILGFSAVPNGSMIKILPSTTARSSGLPMGKGKGAEAVVRVIHLQNVPAPELVPLIRPLLPEWAIVTAYVPTNTLLLAGTAKTLNQAYTIISNIDKQSASQYQVVNLQYATASQVVKTIKELQTQDPSGAQLPRASLAAEDQVNSIIVKGTIKQRSEMVRLIRLLDKRGPVITSNTRVIFLNYMKAEELGPLLAKLVTGESDLGVPDVSTTGTAEHTPRAVTTTLEHRGHHDNATGGGNSEVSIQADKSNNAIIIKAPPAMMNSLVKVIHQLDHRPQQVLVEAVIAQVSESLTNELGVIWTNKFILDQQTGNGQGQNAQVSGGPISAATLYILKAGDLRALVQALSSNTQADILSTPTLVILDNQKGSVSVGQTVSISTGNISDTNTNTDNEPVLVNQFAREKINLTLEVTPQISPNNTVRLTVKQTDDSLQNPENVNTQPIVDTSELQTQVLVNSGDIVVLGGLIRHELETSNQKLPILGDIPIVGRLFNYNTKRIQEKDLIIFLKPTIIGTRREYVEQTGPAYARMRHLQLQRRCGRDLIENPCQTPLLPPQHITVNIPPPFSQR